jgi:hypothetical protein
MADEYSKRASLNQHFESDDDHAESCFLAVAHIGSDWPFLTVTQRFSPAGCGFEPGAIIVPETNRLFIGAGTRVLAYGLDPATRLWEDMTDAGFWGWARHGNTIVMSAELELAAWNLYGKKLWSTFVEPPWNYDVTNDTVDLDIMGVKSSFNLKSGPMGIGT